MILSGEMTLRRVRQKTKKHLAKKTLAGNRKEMARPREARSAQKKVRRRSSDAWYSSSRIRINLQLATSTSTCMARMGE
jgi:hypothetical protein